MEVPTSINHLQRAWSYPSSFQQRNFHFSLLQDIWYSVYPLTFLSLFITHVSSPLTSSFAFLNFLQLLIDFFSFVFATREASQAASAWNSTEEKSEVSNRKLDYSLCIILEISYLLWKYHIKVSKENGFLLASKQNFYPVLSQQVAETKGI